ncbi:MAG: S-adenosylmethionine synthetase N-terminal domain-containing protein [Bacteroidia bacterium]
MSNHTYQFTSESVSAGHPDKVADQISDAILDAYLAQDPNAKVACECLITTQKLLIAGEVTSTASVDAVAIAQEVLDRIGYNTDAVGFNWHTAEIRCVIHAQSPEIHNSVIDGGAGDQGIMFGHACSDTLDYNPLAISESNGMITSVIGNSFVFDGFFVVLGSWAIDVYTKLIQTCLNRVTPQSSSP